MLRVNLYKHPSTASDNRSLLKNHDYILVKNLPGPFQPDGVTPVFVIDPDSDRLFPESNAPEGKTPFAFGGTYAASSDSRWSDKFGFKAIPVMDWSTTWQEYYTLTS